MLTSRQKKFCFHGNSNCRWSRKSNCYKHWNENRNRKNSKRDSNRKRTNTFTNKLTTIGQAIGCNSHNNSFYFRPSFLFYTKTFCVFSLYNRHCPCCCSYSRGSSSCCNTYLSSWNSPPFKKECNYTKAAVC